MNKGIVKCMYILVLSQNMNIRNFYRKYKSEIRTYNDIVYMRSIKESIRKLNNFSGGAFLHEITNFIDKHIGFDRE